MRRPEVGTSRSRSHTDDDGESETRVEARPPGLGGGESETPSRGSSRVREGDKIEADSGRRRGFEIQTGVHTYDIAYDDGERETRVSKRLIRKQRGEQPEPEPVPEPQSITAAARWYA